MARTVLNMSKSLDLVRTLQAPAVLHLRDEVRRS